MFFNGQITRTIKSYHPKNEAFSKALWQNSQQISSTEYLPASRLLSACLQVRDLKSFAKLENRERSSTILPRKLATFEMLYVNHHTICRTNQKHWFLRWLANGVFQNNDLCWQAFPFPPPPSPLPLLHFLFHNSFPPPPSLHFSLVPISCAAKLSKSRSSVFLCSKNPQKRLLRKAKCSAIKCGLSFSLLRSGILTVRGSCEPQEKDVEILFPVLYGPGF